MNILFKRSPENVISCSTNTIQRKVEQMEKKMALAIYKKKNTKKVGIERRKKYVENIYERQTCYQSSLF